MILLSQLVEAFGPSVHDDLFGILPIGYQNGEPGYHIDVALRLADTADRREAIFAVELADDEDMPWATHRCRTVAP